MKRATKAFILVAVMLASTFFGAHAAKRVYEYFDGKVLSVLPDGYLAIHETGTIYKIKIKRVNRVDGDTLWLPVVSEGEVFEYTSALGAKKTVRVLRVLTDEEEKAADKKYWAEIEAEEQAETKKNLETLAARIKERDKIIKQEIDRHTQEEQKKRAEIQAKVWAMYLRNASNGWPSYQFEVGTNYLGQGNTNLARYWLTKSAAQGHTNAQAVLKTIR